MSLSLANHQASLPIAHRLYLPESWANDPQRRKAAKVPQDIAFQTKPQIALQQVRDAQAAGLSLGTVLSDAGYGYDSQFRAGLTKLGLAYVVGIQSNVLIWQADASLPLQGQGGRKPSRPQQRAQQVSVKAHALSLPATAWQRVTWREDGAAFTSRFTRLRVRPVTGAEQPAEEWLLIEYPEDEAEPTKYWLSTLSGEIGLADLVDRAKLRWRIERDYQDLKQELGLGHYEGRGWRGLHHHVTLCVAAYGFLIAERALFSPPDRSSPPRSKTPGVPTRERSHRAAAASGATPAKLRRYASSQTDAGSG